MLLSVSFICIYLELSDVVRCKRLTLKIFMKMLTRVLIWFSISGGASILRRGEKENEIQGAAADSRPKFLAEPALGSSRMGAGLAR